MQKTLNILRMWLWLLLLSFFAWLLPQPAAADRYVEKGYNYMVMLNGMNSIRIKAPVYDEKWDDYWVKDGNLKVKWKDDSGNSHDDVVLHWGTKSHDNDDSELSTEFRTDVGGSIDITQGNSSNHFMLTKGDKTKSCNITENSGANTYDFTANWTLPYEMLGKQLEFYWSVTLDRTTAGTPKVDDKLTGATIDMPAAQSVMTPIVTTAMLSYSKPGMMEIPWVMPSDKVTSAYYEYIDDNGKKVKQTILTNTNSGIIYLSVLEPRNNFRVYVSYKDNSGYQINNIASDVQNIPVIHAPHGLTVRPLGGAKSKVEVKWNVGYTDVADMALTDFFEIERSLTGLESDFEPIGQVLFSEDLCKEGVFTFVDSTLVEAIDARMLQDGNTLNHVTYRVRRAMSSNWGWGLDNNCASSASCTLEQLHLLRIANYTAEWEDSLSYTVRVAWDYANEIGGVWDDRAEMVLRVNMKNRAGELVDSMLYVLNSTEREQRYKILTFTRPCIDFDIDMSVDRKQSPIQLLDKPTDLFFPISNAKDWTTFRDMVAKAQGKYDVNARLYADIPETDVSIGWDANFAYRGIFDGNGHTLTFKAPYDERFMAPFRYVGNATIRNLRTAGTVKTSERNVAGLIANVIEGSTVNIENCRSSVTINTTYNGASDNGGFIGRVSGANVTIRNSMFDGSFEGENSTENGGFIGWIAPNSNVVIDNSLFTPDHISTSLSECNTWACQDNSSTANFTLSVRYSFASMGYEEGEKTTVIDGKTFMVLYNNADWLKFKEAVKTDYYTNAILANDFTVTECVAFQGEGTFRGIFDGNGHKLTLNLNEADAKVSPFGLFQYGQGCTIKNLHLDGKIKGGDHVAALVGYAGEVSGKWTDINNCRVSVSVESSGGMAGGFVGRGTNANIQNCLFDGHIWCKKEQANGSQNWAGAFHGFRDGDAGTTVTNAAVQNCLEKAEWHNIIHQHLNVKPWTSWGNGENSDTKNNWSYTGVAGASKVTGESVQTMASYLGSANWQVVDGKVVPKMSKRIFDAEVYASQEIIDSINVNLINGWMRVNGHPVPAVTSIDEPTYPIYTKPTLKTFHHESLGKIELELLTITRQSSVVLAWNTDGNPIDYFTVMRRVKGQGDKDWKKIATHITDMSYEDTSVSPLLTYEYMVRATSDCEGENHTSTNIQTGESKHTGRLEGYVRFNDGTGVPKVNVDIIYGNNKVKSVITDESGFFEADELSYQGDSTVTYKVSPVGEAIQLETDHYMVTFNAHSNNETVHEFILTNGKRFSGYVMYEGTSIPVKGVNFKVNGMLIHNAKGDYVESDYDGSFSFRVKEGDNTIQAVMDKHKFVNGGWYKNSNVQDIRDDIAGIYFYDSTKVKLTGRIVGGDEQGSKPLGNNLSKNNLGDSLQMVLTLEGDNTSWLVYDNLNPNRTERTTVYKHKLHALHPSTVKPYQTLVETKRKRIIVTPDVRTGEYELMLPPVRWKVQQVYCTGYPTLFQKGQVSEVIDLTDCLDEKDTTYVGTFTDLNKNSVYKPTLKYNAIYNRIYHNPVEVTYRQKGYDEFDYFGDKSYMATNLAGKQSEVPLAYMGPDSLTHYTFDYPVFSLERKYYIQLQVAENYPYNNDPLSRDIDLVKVGGGIATMHNGLNSGVTSLEDYQLIDSLGQAVFTVKASQVSKLLTKTDALKTITFSVEQDNTHYEAKPLQAYVLNMFPLAEGKDILADGQPVLFDILRDPPGAYSSSTLAKGATINYSYMINLALSGGMAITATVGQQKETFFGTVNTTISGAPGTSTGHTGGYTSSSDNTAVTLQDLVFNMQGSKAWSYTVNVGENISTSGDPSMVGADADLYIGTVQNMQVAPMSTIRAITDSMYVEISTRLADPDAGSEGPLANYRQYGTLVPIAEGYDANGKKFHLVRDLSLGYGPKLQSNFIYSQKQLLTQIIPDKVKEILALMYTGTEDSAQVLANKTKRPVYLSLRTPGDPKYALPNGKYGDYHNTSIKVPNDTINYVMVLPAGANKSDFEDEVNEKAEIIYAWMQMITQNEHEKLYASDHVVNYDIAGAQGVNHSETFATQYTNSEMLHFPWGKQPDYFTKTNKNGSWQAPVSLAATFLGGLVAAQFSKLALTSKPNNPSQWIQEKDGQKYTEIKFTGMVLKWALVPALSMVSQGTDSKTSSYTRTESFTIACDPMSRLNVDVYRVATRDTATIHGQNVAATDIFTNLNYNSLSEDVLGHMKGRLQDVYNTPRGFVFRTRGGATQNQWEDERRTLFYQAGSLLDERTQKICNPKIRLDKQSVSGVSINDAARFTVYLSNESEKPEATGGLTVLQLFAPDNANPSGAKISVNGQTLTTSGMAVSVVPGMETALQMEVRAGQGFDFNDLAIGVMSPTDADHTTTLTTFDVHFMHEAGDVNILTPGDKWVLNTDAEKDSKRGWFIPVIINGFDRHQHNFDHIELQYKESQRGDDTWTNLCSFYADETLMAKANGVCKMIPENDNIVTEFYGEGWTMERNYDLRAVVFCRNGSDFLTKPSKVISGIKDTRRPQLFGTPEPKNGLITQGDDIIFNFSEDIEYNYLSAITNFEVKGEVNNDNLSELVSVQFNGQASVESDAKRNFSGKDLTIDLMIKPAETQRDMPLFSHGTNGQKLQLWLTKDFKLKAVVDDQTYTSDSVIGKNAFRQVAMVLNQTDSLLTFFKGGLEIGRHKLNAPYNGTGTLIFGRTNEQDRSHSQYYEGRMMEARLWYSAMDGSLIGTTYGNHHLTGYEKDLVDYYPMNEGSGDYVIDHTQGANAKLINANWAIPRGLSLHLDKADKGVLLTQDAMNRSAEHDYTLMFWFKTDADGRGTLLSNGRGKKEDLGAENQFHIGFEAEKLMYRSNGFAVEVPGDWSDGQWHNFAMTVNRGRNVANIYVDKNLRTTFEADSLGGISGGYPLIGATRYDHTTETGETVVIDDTDALTGNVDELMFFAQALPQQLISTYASKSPNGDEAGLMTYLSFDRIERQSDNDLELVPYAYSKKLYLDDKGQPRYQLDPQTKESTGILVRDYLFVDEEDVVLKHFDASQAAPVVPYEEVKNLKFSFIGKGNQVLVELDESAARLNHRNIYVTLRDIEDKNGNTMASPQTACYYVTNSSLQWLVNRLDYTVKYGVGDTLSLPFYNYGATNHTYTIENCPRWLTLDSYTDAMAPQSLSYVDATINKGLNIGTYNEIIYLTDEEGITEPFYLNLTVEGEQPEWATSIDGDLLENSMNISGQVYLFDEIDTDTRDIVGVFDSNNVCHGFANISHDVQSGEAGLFLTVYDNQANGRLLNFRLWQYSTGRELVLTPQDTIKFAKDAILGTEQPVRFDGRNSFVQNFSLKKGWNWVSFNVQSERLFNLNKLLSSISWSNGDILTDMSSDLTLTYDKAQKLWIATDSTTQVVISPKKAYAIKVKEACSFPIEGTVIKNADARTIKLKQGWNAIGYTPMTNLTVETALSDYFDNAEPGDVIKSHTEFAYFTKTGNTGRWRGSLQYMKPGEGYMMLRKGASEASFTYPYYDMNSNFYEDWTQSAKRAFSPQLRNTMSLSATVVGFEPEEGDRLVAYANGEVVGDGMLTEDDGQLFYLSIAGEANQSIRFAIEREGETVASTGDIMTFQANDVIGSPDEPTAINFAQTAQEYCTAGKWYTISGVQLQKKPTQPGVYIFNGKKILIK